jgi:glycosyltransferase involved in cell wall biosynthesis
MPQPKITIFVPTYNRGKLLERVYESLKVQTCQDFEWVIVDDGSTDDTTSIVQSWVAENPFPIQYHRKENGGKHTAINPGVQLARGEFMVILDSDDWLTPTALERLLYLWNEIPQAKRHAFSGVVGLCSYPDETIIGDRFPQDPLDSDAVELSYNFNIQGDKISLTRTDVMRAFPFPFENLRGLINEAMVWNRMAQRYQQRCVNEVFAIKEYLEGGLTNRSLELQIQAAPATALYYLELTQVKQRIPWKAHLKCFAQYVRFSLHERKSIPQILSASGSALKCLALLPVGIMAFMRDKRQFGL